MENKNFNTELKRAFKKVIKSELAKGEETAQQIIDAMTKQFIHLATYTSKRATPPTYRTFRDVTVIEDMIDEAFQETNFVMR